MKLHGQQKTDGNQIIATLLLFACNTKSKNKLYYNKVAYTYLHTHWYFLYCQRLISICIWSKYVAAAKWTEQSIRKSGVEPDVPFSFKVVDENDVDISTHIPKETFKVAEHIIAKESKDWYGGFSI